MLEDYVSAELAAENSGFEQHYRYECARCWEGVRLCATDSTQQATHFRHWSGNNNVECEIYKGNRSDVVKDALTRRNVRDKVEFYFSSETKMFSVGVKFNTEEISRHEKNEAFFQIKTEKTSTPIMSVQINGTRFYADMNEIFQINDFSWRYYVSVSNSTSQEKYEVFRKDKDDKLLPSLFKIQAGGDDNSYTAKLVRGNTVFTNTEYLIVFTHQYPSFGFGGDVQVGEVVQFKTMNRDFSVARIVFNQKNATIEKKLNDWNYNLETDESLTVLWPPTTIVDGVAKTTSGNVFLYSTFELQAHGNINLNSKDIAYLGNGITKVSVNEKAKIYKKNAELLLNRETLEADEFIPILVERKVKRNYKTTHDNSFLFSRVGVTLLGKGMSVALTTSSIIKRYSQGYLCEVILPPEWYALSGKALLQDVLMHYHFTETFIWEDFETAELSQSAFEYIEKCEKLGKINAAAKRFIVEGRI
jgi:hypothetical protein